jgi:hypothetical protein
MSAFSYGAKNQIRQNIAALFERVRAVSKTPLTHEQFSSLFIPAEHRGMYREMAQLASGWSHNSTSVKWGSVTLKFAMNNWDAKRALPIPRDVALQHDAPAELVSDITSWAANGGDVSGDYGRVMALFDYLNDNLTKGQIRFVWPSILTVLGVTDIMSETLKDLQEIRVPSKPPELPRGLLAICRKTAGAVATASLIPADVEPFKEGEGYIEVANGQKYTEEGLGEFHGLS